MNSKTSKIFLDANIILDFTLKRGGYEDAKSILQLVIDGKTKGYITPGIVQICGYWLTKAYGLKLTRELLLSLLNDISVIDVPEELVKSALRSDIEDIEDALQYYAAIHYKLDYFISQDKQLKKVSYSQLPVLSSKAFLKETGY